MAQIIDTLRPGATRNQGGTDRTRETGQRPIQRPCNSVTQNEQNDARTETTPGNENKAKTNATELSKNKITGKRDNPNRCDNQNAQATRNPKLTLHKKGAVENLGAKKAGISHECFRRSPHDPRGRSGRALRPKWQPWTRTNSLQSHMSKLMSLRQCAKWPKFSAHHARRPPKARQKPTGCRRTAKDPCADQVTM